MQNPISKTVTLLLIVLIVVLNFLYPNVEVLTWDVFGYYLYLPLSFIYHDLRLENVDVALALHEKFDTATSLYQVFKSPEGSWVLKYSMGWALINAPFFFIGHITALLTEYPADGFSLPYQKAIWAGAMSYTILALVLLRKSLVRFFSDRTSALILIVIVLGTNYLYSASFIGQNTAAQNYGFIFYALILWFTVRWHSSYRMRDAVLLAVFCGLNILSRPTEAVCLLIPLLWGVSDRESLRVKFKLLFEGKRRQIIVFGLILLGIGSLQFAYWKMTSGELIYYSYGNQGGEGLDLHNPNILKVVFSFRKGWLVYTPLMFFTLYGFRTLYQKNRSIFYAILLYFIVNLYFVSSWSTWWYAASYGQRALIPSYIMLALPLGYLLKEINASRWIKKGPLLLLITMLVGLNLFQIWQYTEGIIDISRMTRAYYFRVFLKTKVTDEDRKLLLVSRDEWPIEHVPDENDYRKSRLYFNDFGNEGMQTDDTAGYRRLEPDHKYTPALRVAYRDLTRRDHVYLRATAEIFMPEECRDDTTLMVMTAEHKGRLYKYNALGLDTGDIRYNDWNRFSMDYLSPEIRNRRDKLGVYLWYRGDDFVYVRNFEVLLFEPLARK